MSRIRRELAGGPRAGGALSLALLAVIVVAVLAASFLETAAAVTRSQAQSVDKKHSFYMAEAGLAEAFAGLSIGKTGEVGSEEDPAVFGNGLFWVEATEVVGDLVQLDSTGMVGGGRAQLSLVARPGEFSVASLGIFAAERVEIGPGVVIDGFDSSDGTYNAQANDLDMPGHDEGADDDRSEKILAAELGSNGDMVVSGTAQDPVIIYGNLTPGPDSQVTTSGSFVITGSTTPAAEQRVLPSVETPDIALAPGRDHKSGIPLTIPAGEFGIEYLNVGRNAEVILQGPATIVMGSLTVEELASLSFDTTEGNIELFVTNDLNFADGSIISVTNPDASEVTIQVEGESERAVRLEGDSNFYGVVYAPENDVFVSSDFEIFGALVGNRLSFGGPVRLHFDRHLLALSAESALPKLFSWRILGLEAQAALLNRDPFDVMGVDKDLLRKPAQAHKDQFLEVHYVSGGADLFFSGQESAFDWSDVDQVHELQRDGNDVVGGDVLADPDSESSLSAGELDMLVGSELPLGHVKNILIRHSPLPPAVLTSVQNRVPPFPANMLADIMDVQ